MYTAHIAELYCVGKVELRLLDCVFVDFRGIIAVNLYSEFTEGYLTATHTVEKAQYIHFSFSLSSQLW